MSNSTDTLIIKETTEIIPKTVSKTILSTNVDKDAESLDFNRSNIEKLDSVNLVDSDEVNGLDMFCYAKCNNNDSEIIKQCRGVVFNGNNIVMKAFPYTVEFNHTELDGIKMLDSFDEWVFYESQEGALIRMFYFNEKWFVSTHRKLDAFRSKWASRDSFGSSFLSALSSEEENNPSFKEGLSKGPEGTIFERFEMTLDKEKQYMFLVRNNKDNRIVCSEPDRPTVYHVGTFVNGSLVFTEDINIPSPKKLKLKNKEELQSYVESLSYKDYQGVIGFYV